MKSNPILFACHDPGAANLILAMVNLIDRSIPSRVLALGPSIRRIEAAMGRKPLIPESEPVPGFPMESNVREDSLLSILEELQPAAILTGTSFNSNLDWSIWKWAIERAIPCACMIDFWSGYALRFFRGGQSVLPDRVFVSDETMAKGMRDMWPGYSGIVVAGNPHLAKKIQAVGKSRKSQSLSGEFGKVRFFSENIHHYFPERRPNEFDFVRMLLDYSRGGLDEIVIRPHPMENKNVWKTWISAQEASPINMSLELSPIEDALADPSFVSVGISSMALIESALAGIATYSLQLGLDRTEDYLFIPFDDYGIRSIKSEGELSTIWSTPHSVPTVQMPSDGSREIINWLLGGGGPEL